MSMNELIFSQRGRQLRYESNQSMATGKVLLQLTDGPSGRRRDISQAHSSPSGPLLAGQFSEDGEIAEAPKAI